MRLQNFVRTGSVATILTVAAFGQAPPAASGPPAPPTNVTFDRILNAKKEPQNWLSYSGDGSSQRHSMLTQINAANAKEMELKWVFQSNSLERHEVTPLVVNGIMYTIQSPNDVIALNASTGRKLWTYFHKPAPETKNPCCGNLSRGVAILGNTLFLGTLDAQLIAINASTGKEMWKTQVADYKDQYSITHAPLVIKDKVIVGVAGGEHGIRGFIAAYNVADGKEVWRFNTVPGPGEKGYETWSGDSYLHGGAPIWVTGSYDPTTNLTYWGTGNPGPDWDGSARLGDNLYSCSVIALDPDTGKLAWHYQFNPHNEFDWDATQVPVLADIQFEGKPRKTLLWANRNGMFYVLDRTNGQFLLGKPFTKINWNKGFDEKGRPMMAPEVTPTKAGALTYPGNQGGTNWYNPSYSPETNLFYVPTWENTSTTYVKGDEPPEFHAGQSFSGPFPKAGSNKDDVSSLIQAIDPATGTRKWAFTLSAPSTEGGILTTAGNVLIGGGRDGQFVALDARDGKKLWETYLGASVSAGPITYMVDGKQYVSIQVGNVLFTFGLR